MGRGSYLRAVSEEIGEGNKEVKNCICKYEDLEKGCKLYLQDYQDGDYLYTHIQHVRYCPVCGKELPGEEE